MKKILIATHSTFAMGIANSINLLVGEQSCITTINAYVDDSDYSTEIDAFFADYDETVDYIVFTDLYGGSVNQKIVKYQEQHKFYLITGFNLPIVLEVLLCNEELSERKVDNLIESCRLELARVELAELINDDEEDFL